MTTPAQILQKERAKAKREALEAEFMRQILAEKLPLPRREYRFHPTRRWRLDFAWPKQKVAVEIEGLTREGGRHQRIDGFVNDCDKYNYAVMAGWTLLRFAKPHLKDLSGLRMTKRALETN